MKALELGKHRRARVWIGELPDTACPSVKTLTHTIAADRESQHGLRLAAIEVCVPLGPRLMYGLQDGQLLLGGNAAAPPAFGRWIWVHLHKVKRAFQVIQISTGADQFWLLTPGR